MSAIATQADEMRPRLVRVAVAASIVAVTTWAYGQLSDRFWWLPSGVGPLPAPLDEVAPLVAAVGTLVLGLILMTGPTTSQRVLIAFAVLLAVVVARNVWWTYQGPRLIGPTKWRETIWSLVVSVVSASAIFWAWFRSRHTSSFGTQLVMGAMFVAWLFCLASSRVVGYGI